MILEMRQISVCLCGHGRVDKEKHLTGIIPQAADALLCLNSESSREPGKGEMTANSFMS